MKDTIEYGDFEKLDLRVGRVVAAEAPEWSNKLLQFTVDLGPEIGEKTILSGIKQWYAPEVFVGNLYVFVVNLAERKMGQAVSQGMMIMADGEDQPKPFALTVSAEPGEVVR
ncbi:MAG: methionine--tRNA ligase [bacterium]|nr:methionine--tRNA ligase [bacterium]